MVEHYHADNGVFRANKWVAEECKHMGQGTSYTGVNAHHQNGMAERRVRELQDLARTILIHSKNARWKDSISTHLWPYYAVRTTNDAINHTPSFFQPGTEPTHSY
jgi:hypothetical protein